jgi:hypothetical protein
MPLLTDVYSIESIKFIGQLVGAFLLIVWVLLRTKSIAPLHLMLMKLFRVKASEDSIAIRRYIKNLSALMIFRFSTGLHPSTKRNADELIQWAEEKNISLIDVASCGEYFDPNTQKILSENFPAEYIKYLRQICGLFLILLSSGLLVLAASPNAIIKFNGSNTWAEINENSATELLGGAPLITQENADCKQTIQTIKSSPLEPEELTALCDFFKSKEKAAYIHGVIKTQRLVGIYYALVFILLLFSYCALPISRLNAAKKIMKDINLTE